MAGYIFSLDNLHSLSLYTQYGIYATKLSPPTRTWRAHHEGTFADYATMEAGDNVYFFINRKIYGIGKLINVGSDCKFFNFPNAGMPRIFSYHEIQPKLLWDEGENSVNQRCICLFKPDPYFFEGGVDMDDVLSSNPTAFKMLRAFWKLSFIKFDDEENQAFRNILLKRNQLVLANQELGNGIFHFQSTLHKQLERRISKDYELKSGIYSMLENCAAGGALKHEMAIEAGLLYQLSIKDSNACTIFGEWDYLSHQVIASPFKPIDYMDKMDLFGYSYIPAYKPTKSRFLVGEIKKDSARTEDVDQLLKYVDWVRDEYCFGDYSLINAFLIAHHFDSNVIAHKRSVGIRNYTLGVKPTRSLEWNKVKLVKYSFNKDSRLLEFREIT